MSKDKSKKSLAIDDDFDFLEDELNLNFNKKKDAPLNAKNNRKGKSKMSYDNDFDDLLDQPDIITTKPNQIKNSSKLITPPQAPLFTNKSQLKLQDTIIDEDNDQIGRARSKDKSKANSSIKLPEDNIIETPEIFTSSRNMRPPLKKKQSQTGLTQKGSLKNLGLSISEDKQLVKQTSALTINLDNQSSKPLNLNRRVSVDSKTEKRGQTGLTLFDNSKQSKRQQKTISHFQIPFKKQIDSIKVDSEEDKRKFEISQMKIGQSIIINDKKVYTSNNLNQHTNLFKGPQMDVIDTNRSIALERKNESSFSFQKPNNSKLVEPPKILNFQQIDNRHFLQYKKELDHIKQVYQKQIKHLQQSLDRQLRLNNQTRQRLISDSNNLIEQQRKRMNRVHQQQIKRVKQINQWEKKKFQDRYQFQIKNLKQTITQYQQDSLRSNTLLNQPQQETKYKKQMERLSQQLQIQKKYLFDRQNYLSKRQLQIQHRQSQLSGTIRKQEQRIRQKQKALLQKQGQLKTTLINDKRNVIEQKQKIAIEMAQMEIDMGKKKEKLDTLIRQAEIQKQGHVRQRNEVRVMSKQLGSRYKQKVQQLDRQRHRISQIQAQLIRKLRVVQNKTRQVNNTVTQINQNKTSKQNIWVRPRPAGSLDQKRQRLNQTMTRYNKVEGSINKKRQSIRQGFDLDNFMVKHDKIKINNFL